MPDQPETNPEVMFRNWQIMWGAIFSSYLMFAATAWFAGQPESLTGRSNFIPLFPVLALAGATTLAVSFMLKKRIMEQAVTQQKPLLLQNAYILSWALCEATCLLGLVGIFTTKALAFYALFVLAAFGMMAHRPSQDALYATGYKKF